MTNDLLTRIGQDESKARLKDLAAVKRGEMTLTQAQKNVKLRKKPNV